MKKTMCVLASVLLAGGCAGAFKPEYEPIDEQWAQNIKRLGADIEAVYPPSEEFQLGDVFAVDYSNRRTLRIGNVPEIYRRAEAVYAGRLQLPATVFNNTEVNKNIDQRSPKGSAFSGRFKDTLPIAAFPEYTVASGYLAQFAASLPGQLFGLLFGFGKAEDTYLKVSMEDNSTYGVTTYDAQYFLDRFCQGDGYKNPCDGKRMADAFAAAYGTYPTDGVSVRMISRVYVARTIRYSYIFRSATAAKVVAARLETMKAFSDKAAALVTPTEAQKDDPKTATNESVNSARDQLLKQMLDSLNKDINALSASGGSGATLSAASYNGNSVSLSQSFARPLTFAYGGIWLPPEGSKGQRPPPPAASSKVKRPKDTYVPLHPMVITPTPGTGSDPTR